MDKTSLKSILFRLKAPMPLFFKRLFWIMVSIGSLGTSIITLNKLYALPSVYTENAVHLIIIGIIGSFFSKLTVDWEKLKNENLKPEENEDNG